MRRDILFIILFLINFACELRFVDYNVDDISINKDYQSSDIVQLDSEYNAVTFEKYMCERAINVKDCNVYVDNKSGSIYLLKYNEEEKNPKVYKYDFNGIVWEKELETAERYGNYIEYIDENENLYISQCDTIGSGSCGNMHILYLSKYKKYTDKYREVFHYFIKLSNGNERDYVSSISIDSSGNIYVAGEFVDQINFGYGQIVKNNSDCKYTGGYYDPWSCPTDVFLVKFDRDGKPVWSKVFGGVLDDFVGNILLYENSLYVYLISDSEKYIDGKKIYISLGEAKIIKISTDGDYRWSKSIAESIVSWTGPTIDRQGNIYIAGRFDLHSIYTDADKYKDLIIAKFDNSGEFIWGRKFDSDNIKSETMKKILEHLFINSLSVDEELKIYISGTFEITEERSYGSRYNFLSKYDKNGNRIWYREFEKDGMIFGDIKLTNITSCLFYLLGQVSYGGEKEIDKCYMNGYNQSDNNYLLKFVNEECE